MNKSILKLKLENILYGVNENLYIKEDIGFNFKYKNKWMKENEIPLVNRSLESYVLIFPKDTIEMQGSFFNGFAKIMDKQRANDTSLFAEDIKMIDSISFVLRYFSTDYQLSEINILDITHSDKYKSFNKTIYSKIHEYNMKTPLYNLIDSVMEINDEEYEMRIFTSK